MRALGKEGAYLGDVAPLHTRYVSGRGATHLTLAYSYLKCVT